MAGLLRGMGQILMTSAYCFTEASVIASIDHTLVLGALLIRYFLFDEIPGPPIMGGASLVISASVVIIWRKGHLGLQRGKACRSMKPQGLGFQI